MRPSLPDAAVPRVDSQNKLCRKAAAHAAKPLRLTDRLRADHQPREAHVDQAGDVGERLLARGPDGEPGLRAWLHEPRATLRATCEQVTSKLMQMAITIPEELTIRFAAERRLPLVVNMSFGVNVNSFGEDTAIRISPSNTFAWRLGWGADYRLNARFALNTEWAYKRNDGHTTGTGGRNDDWNASSFGFLFGGKMFF